jgi:hypothetical protein
MKTTWEAGSEVDALLAVLREDHPGMVDTLSTMSVPDLAAFRRDLFILLVAIREVGITKARQELASR